MKVGFSGHVAAEEAVGVFDGAALPRGMGVAEVGLRRQLGVEVLMEGEFAAVVEGDRSTGGFRQWAEDLSRASSVVSACLFGNGAVNVKRVFLSQRVSRLPR